MKLYVVQKGDTLEKIAHKHGMTIDEFRKMNTNLTEGSLAQGMKVRVAIGKQPIKRAAVSSNERSEAVHHAATQQQPAQQVPQPAAPSPEAPAKPKPKPNLSGAQSQSDNEATTDYSQILYPKHPQNNWTPEGLGSYPDFSSPAAVSPETGGPVQSGNATSYYPMGSFGNPFNAAVQSGSNLGNGAVQGPNTGHVVSPVSQGPNMGHAISPAAQSPNMGNVVSPVSQGPNMGHAISPAAQSPNMGNVVSPATQGPNMGHVVSPAAQSPNTGNVVSPAQGNGSNPYYPNTTVGNTWKNPVYYPAQAGKANKQSPQLQPWNGPQPQYPISQKNVTLDKAFVSGNHAQNNTKAPWMNQQITGAPKKPIMPQTSPTGTSKLSPLDYGTLGGNPYAYPSSKTQPKKPCNCGGPVSPLPYGGMSAPGYYGGNQPPHPQPLPYWAMPNVSAPVYQPQSPSSKTKQ